MRSMLNRRPAPVRQQPPQSSDGLLLDVRNLKTYFHVMDGVVKAVDAVDRLHDAVHHVEVGLEVADVKQEAVARLRGLLPDRGGPTVQHRSHRYARLCGSSASRSPSPMKLIAITVRAIAMPGKNAHHQLPRMSEFCAFDSALPQLVWSCRIPKLRKLTNASSTMFEAMISVIETITGPSVLGRM